MISEETRKKLSESHKGKSWGRHTEEWKIQMSKSKKGKPFSGIPFDPTGIKLSKETREKMSQSHKGNTHGFRKGQQHYNWKGGISNNIFHRRTQKMISQGKRRAIKNKAEGFHTFGEWELLKKQYGYTCPSCGKKEPEIKLTEDHIIPLSKGGSNYIENIQPLCRNCNSKKQIKIIKF